LELKKIIKEIKMEENVRYVMMREIVTYNHACDPEILASIITDSNTKGEWSLEDSEEFVRDYFAKVGSKTIKLKGSIDRFPDLSEAAYDALTEEQKKYWTCKPNAGVAIHLVRGDARGPDLSGYSLLKIREGELKIEEWVPTERLEHYLNEERKLKND